MTDGLFCKHLGFDLVQKSLEQRCERDCKSRPAKTVVQGNLAFRNERTLVQGNLAFQNERTLVQGNLALQN